LIFAVIRHHTRTPEPSPIADRRSPIAHSRSHHRALLSLPPSIDLWVHSLDARRAAQEARRIEVRAASAAVAASSAAACSSLLFYSPLAASSAAACSSLLFYTPLSLLLSLLLFIISAVVVSPSPAATAHCCRCHNGEY
jgi:hypothetical protein